METKEIKINLPIDITTFYEIGNVTVYMDIQHMKRKYQSWYARSRRLMQS